MTTPETPETPDTSETPETPGACEGSDRGPDQAPSEAPIARSRRRSFGPVVVLGLAFAALAAFAGTRSWVEVDGATGQVSGLGTSGMATTAEFGEAPLAGALGLVLLACWGAVLVTRGLFRRVIAVGALLAALGIVWVAVDAWRTLVVDTAAQIAAAGAGSDADLALGIWSFVSAAAALASAVLAVVAVLVARHWPEMGTRYDAPGADAQARERSAAPETPLDLWRAIDDGEDPTR